MKHLTTMGHLTGIFAALAPNVAKGVAASALMMGLAALACDRGATEGDSGASKTQLAVLATEPVPGGGEAPKATPSKAQASFNESAFSLGISAGEAQVGQPAQATIRLEAKGDYKVNAEYPFKFKPQSTASISFGTDVVGKDAVKLEHKSAVMTVPFTAKSAGEHKVTGLFSFSVCTEERCLIEKRDLELVVRAK